MALSLPRVVVQVSPRSLWRLGFEQVFVDQPKLDVRRLADGRITVAGLEIMTAGGGDSAGLDWFFSQIEFVIQGGTVRWTDEVRGNEPLMLQNVNALVRSADPLTVSRLFGLYEGWLAIASTSEVRASSTTMVPDSAPASWIARFSSR